MLGWAFHAQPRWKIGISIRYCIMFWQWITIWFLVPLKWASLSANSQTPVLKILNCRDFSNSIHLFINCMKEISVVLNFNSISSYSCQKNSISSYSTINHSVFPKPNKWKDKNFHNPKTNPLPKLCYSTSIYLRGYALSRGRGAQFLNLGNT